MTPQDQVAPLARAVTLRTMKTAAALVIAALIWCYPLAAEGTLGACDALASQALHLETTPASGPGKPDSVTLIRPIGDYSAAKSVQRRYPLVPAGLVCAGYYWRLLADPDFIDTIKNPNDTQ
jgi:hypothetical protein